MYNKTTCNLRTYTTCFEENNTSGCDEAQDRLIHCEENCLDKCERTTYFIKPDGVNYYESIRAPTNQVLYALAMLSVENYDYPIFEETWKWTFPSFFGTVGGTLGLWLGINVLDSVIYIIIRIKVLTQGQKTETVEENTNKAAFKYTEKNGADNTISQSKR